MTLAPLPGPLRALRLARPFRCGITHPSPVSVRWALPGPGYLTFRGWLIAKCAGTIRRAAGRPGLNRFGVPGLHGCPASGAPALQRPGSPAPRRPAPHRNGASRRRRNCGSARGAGSGRAPQPVPHPLNQIPARLLSRSHRGRIDDDGSISSANEGGAAGSASTMDASAVASIATVTSSSCTTGSAG